MPMTATPDRHISAAKTRLAHLAGLSSKTASAERAILTAAEHRLAAVEKEAAAVAGRVLTDMDAADRYTALVQERGRLRLVIATSREALSL
jgi:hypothetical protein